MVLETISYSAGMRTRADLKAICNPTVIENLMQLVVIRQIASVEEFQKMKPPDYTKEDSSQTTS